MADRSVKVRLDADVKGYQAGIRTAVKATEDFEKRASGYITKHSQSINDVSNMALGAGAIMTGFAAVTVKASADFDQAMSNVQAGSMETAENMELLRQAALDAGASTVYSATEAADAIEQLAKAGLSTQDILGGGLAGALDLAASGGLEVGQAAEIASVAMKQFGLQGQDVTHIADLLAAGAGKAVGDVDDLGMALNQAGTVANSFGLSVDETVGGLAAFAEAGMIGSDAGTMLRTMLQRLGNPAGKAAELMDELGISVYDAQGEFIGLDGVAGELNTAFAGMNQESRNAAMGVIFGADAIRGANVLYAEGEQGIQDWNAAVDDQGYAAEQAAIRLDNLKGDLEELGGAFETAFIGMGDGQDGPLRSLVQGATDVVNAFNDMPDGVKSALGMGTGIAGMSLLAIGGVGKLITSVNDARTAMLDLGWEVDKTSGKLKLLGVGSAVGLAITGLTLAIGHFASESAKAQATADSLASTFDDLTGAATASTDTMILEELNKSISAGDWDQLEKIGYSYADVVNAIKNGGPAYDQLWNDIERTRIAANTWTESGREQSKAMSNTADALRDVGPAYRLAAEQQAEMAAGQEALGIAGEEAAAKQDILTGAIEATGVGLEGVIEDMQTFLDLLFATGLATMSARDAQSAYHESVSEVGDTVDELIEKHGGLGTALNDAKTDFDLTTEAGRTANGAFQDIARSGMDVVTSMSDAGASQDELQGKLNTTYDDLISAAGQFGITGDAAEDLARDVLGVPDGVSIETWMSDEAERQAEATQSAINRVDRSITVTTYFRSFGAPGVSTGGGASRPGGSTMTANADGNVWESPTRIKAFANGAENHVAQIAGAGSMRLWAEPETGGEAYIPLALSKRARSERILADVASRFNMGLSKFDNGGIVMPYEPRRAVVSTAPAGVTVSPTFISNGLNAHEAARENEAQMRHVLRSAVPTLAR